MEAQPKTVVISDVHMSNKKKYSWFLPPYPKKLTAMLNRISKDSSVDELVLLGDFFDLWLYPVNVPPCTVTQIIGANRSITEALRRCVKKKRHVYYITGNHDMWVSASDLQAFSSGAKEIQLISPEDYNAQYKNLRHFEHGHAADMFNAPDDSGDTIGGYPLGFFITRLAATAKDQRAAWRASKGLLQALGATHKAMAPARIPVPSMGSFLVEAIISLLQKLARVQDNTLIRFSEKELDNKHTVGEIKTHYRSLYSRWQARYPDYRELHHTMLAGFSSNGLDWYAKKLLSGKGSPKVVLLGHTHHAKSKGGYDNDGCWCIPNQVGHGDVTPSYIEIVGNTATLYPWK